MKAFFKFVVLLAACTAAIAALFCAINAFCSAFPIQKYVDGLTGDSELDGE